MMPIRTFGVSGPSLAYTPPAQRVGSPASSAAAPVVSRNFRRVTRTDHLQAKKWRCCLLSRHAAPSLCLRRVRRGRVGSYASTARARGQSRCDRQATSTLSSVASGRSLGLRCRIYERIGARCRRTVHVENLPLRTTIRRTAIPAFGAVMLECSSEATDSRIANNDSVRHAGDELLRPNDILKARRRNSVCDPMNGLVGLTPCLPDRYHVSGDLHGYRICRDRPQRSRRRINGEYFQIDCSVLLLLDDDAVVAMAAELIPCA